MVPFSPVKNSQPSWQSFIRPMLLISLALHGIVLFTPTSFDRQDKAKPAPEEEKISLTQLPPANQPTAKPSPVARSTPRPISVPRRTASVPRRSAPPSIRRNSPAATQAARTSVQPSPSAPPSPTNSFLTNFPRYPGAQPGSFGLPEPFNASSQNTTDTMSRVKSWFNQQLGAKGYSASVLQDESSRVVFQVSKEGITQYLTLIPSSQGGGTNILLTSGELPSNLGSASVEDPDITQFFENLPIPNAGDNPDEFGNTLWQNATADQLQESNRTSFYDLTTTDAEGNPVTGGGFSNETLKSGIRRALVAVNQPDPQALYNSDFYPNLQVGEYEVKPLGSYGGGQLYEISRDGVKGYLSMVPSASGSSTVIFIWNSSPL